MWKLLQASGETEIIPGTNWRDTVVFLLRITDKAQEVKM